MGDWLLFLVLAPINLRRRAFISNRVSGYSPGSEGPTGTICGHPPRAFGVLLESFSIALYKSAATCIKMPVGHLGQGNGGWFRWLTRTQATLLRWASLLPPARLCSLCCSVAPARLQEGQYVSSQACL